MRINSINLLEIQPQYKLLYLDENNKLKLHFIHGSGIFAIQRNSTSILDIKYDPTNSPQEATVIPLQEGYVKITVEDLGAGRSFTASCIILVSDLHKINLKQDLLLEESTSSNLYVSHFSSNGEEFSEDQYKFIGVQIISEHKTSGSVSKIVKGLDIYQQYEKNVYNKFMVKAKEIGSYEVTAVEYQKKKNYEKELEVYSNSVNIGVFPRLEVRPKKLLLLPDGSYTIKLTGGPSAIGNLKPEGQFQRNIARYFKINDTEIATVDQNGEVTGHIIGHTTVHVMITQEFQGKDGVTEVVELCKRSVHVSVQLATDIKILGAESRSVMSGATFRLLAIIKHFNETFTFGVFPVDYTWTSKQFHVLSLQSLHQKFTDSKDSHKIVSSVEGDQQGINAQAHKAGEAE